MSVTDQYGMSYGLFSQHLISPQGTTAMQAALVDRKLTFRAIFTPVAGLFPSIAVLLGVRWRQDEVVPAVEAG